MELPETGFSRYLLGHNGLHGFREWVFRPGMLFSSRLKWWGEGGYRERPHEGLDLCSYRVEGGLVHSLGKNTWIPSVYDGEVVRVLRDFLGKSVFMRHGLRDTNGNVLHSVYGHIEPLSGVVMGRVFRQGEIIAALADTRDKRIPPHLHVSVAWISPSLRPEELGWGMMLDARKARLIDPLPLVAEGYMVIEED
jgi:murein DD-endopeptidase MepM/ murein hydrolase activator NlpD